MGLAMLTLTLLYDAEHQSSLCMIGGMQNRRLACGIIFWGPDPPAVAECTPYEQL
jgi:hypothetical protein